ncbi:MAG: SDR family oxidoreductase [Clostridiales bacterium]
MKTILITGASRGIGKETAILFAKKRYNVIINYNKSGDEALKIKDELNNKGYSVRAIKADVSNRNEVNEMINEILNIFGSIDVLVNNAGIAGYSLFTEITENEWDNIINVNLKGLFNCTQEVLKIMIKNKKGKIINISSVWGIIGASCEVHYSASKAGVIGLTKALAKEVGLSGIQVNCIAPGVIETDMLNEFTDEDKKQILSEIPMNKFGGIEDISKLIYFLASEKSSYITGQVISPNGGFVI